MIRVVILGMFSPGDKDAARQAADRWEEFAWAGALGGSTATGAAGVGVPIVQHLLAAVAFVEAAGLFLARRARRLANDPPRLNFYVPVVARERQFNTAVFGDDPRVLRAVDFGQTLVNVGDNVSSMVQAAEKAAGAIEAQEAEAAAARTSESRRFARTSANLIFDLGARADEVAQTLAPHLSEAWSSTQQAERRQRWERAGSLADLLPDESLAILYRAGVRIEELRLPRQRRPAQPTLPSTALREATRAAMVLGERLLRWERPTAL